MGNHKIIIYALICILLWGCSGDKAPVEPIPQNPGSPPQISVITASPNPVAQYTLCKLTCSASDVDGDDLTYEWRSDYGEFNKGVVNTYSVYWRSPFESGKYKVNVDVSDGYSTVTAPAMIEVTGNLNTMVLGTITNPSGGNVEGAVVCFDTECNTTNALGQYRLTSLNIGTHPVTITATGYWPFSTSSMVSYGVNRHDFQLEVLAPE